MKAQSATIRGEREKGRAGREETGRAKLLMAFSTQSTATGGGKGKQTWVAALGKKGSHTPPKLFYAPAEKEVSSPYFVLSFPPGAESNKQWGFDWIPQH